MLLTWQASKNCLGVGSGEVTFVDTVTTDSVKQSPRVIMMTDAIWDMRRWHDFVEIQSSSILFHLGRVDRFCIISVLTSYKNWWRKA